MSDAAIAEPPTAGRRADRPGSSTEVVCRWLLRDRIVRTAQRTFECIAHRLLSQRQLLFVLPRELGPLRLGLLGLALEFPLMLLGQGHPLRLGLLAMPRQICLVLFDQSSAILVCLCVQTRQLLLVLLRQSRTFGLDLLACVPSRGRPSESAGDECDSGKRDGSDESAKKEPSGQSGPEDVPEHVQRLVGGCVRVHHQNAHARGESSYQ
ncbi:MAG: hypothetical protein LLG14_00315 [Nocardiaceae bacterium]|nr:hypothetical protein [Nocardiaceae bacterium]